MNTTAASQITEESGTHRLPIRKPRASKKAPKIQEEVQNTELGVVAQVRAALKPNARLATFLGFMLGGFVPLASYVVAHLEIDHENLFSPNNLVGALLVLGGLIFSARTVFAWAKLAFHNAGMAFGFVVLMEGVEIFARTHWLGIAALCYVMAIDGIACGCTLSLKK